MLERVLDRVMIVDDTVIPAELSCVSRLLSLVSFSGLYASVLASDSLPTTCPRHSQGCISTTCDASTTIAANRFDTPSTRSLPVLAVTKIVQPKPQIHLSSRRIQLTGHGRAQVGDFFKFQGPHQTDAASIEVHSHPLFFVRSRYQQ